MIEVLFFAGLQEAVGESKITVEDKNITVKQLKEKLLKTYELPHINQAMIAINEEYATDDTMIENGDTVAFIPPVSGG
ncbi:MAG TPA: molybdopterin converting factor subunit 1 [Bacillota bacterium]|nr:molybdopterin converting factor subunit 1 [Bacillota bacterium]